MGILRNTTPVVALMLFLLIAREIYPYTEPLNAEAADGFVIEKVASGSRKSTRLNSSNHPLYSMPSSA